MPSSVQFSVDDSSPVLAYHPFPDTFAHPNLTAGWNPYFAPSGFASSIGQTGVGQSQHITSRNGSSISLRWHGTSLQLFGNTTAGAALALSLDGASVSPNNTDHTPNLLAFLDGLPHSDHTLVLTAIIPEPSNNSLVVFDKAVITDPPPQNSSNVVFSDHTLDDNDISFTGQWIPLLSPSPVRESQSQGDTAQVTFSGISIRIFGTTSPTSGNYSIILDDIQSPIFSARSSFTQSDSLLFFASGLDPNVSHHIMIRNEGGFLQLKSGRAAFAIFSSGEPTALPSPPENTPPPSSGIGRFAKGTIAALVLAGFLAAALLTALLFYFCIWRPRRRMRHQPHPGDATSQLRRNPEKERNNAIGVVLDIGQQRHPDDDDIIINNPIDASSPISPTSPTSPYSGRHRDADKSPGFTRWKRDIHTLSGLTSLGLKFRHDELDEKSPLSDNGRERDDVNPITPSGVGRMMTLTTQSSYRSLRRLGKKRSGGFPFRFNSGSSGYNNNNNNDNGEGTTSLPQARDEDSLSGFTSLSYASNPNLGQSGDAAAAAAATANLDVQPPSYAASVSRHTTSGSSSMNPSPRNSTGTPSPRQSRGLQERQAMRSSSFERRQQRQSSSSSSSGNQRRQQQQRSDTRMRGIRMLGIGAGASATGPISMRAAIRALSPRISKSRNGGGKKDEEIIEEERDQAGSSQPSIAFASIGHGQDEQQSVEIPRIPPPPVMMMMIPERRKTDSPVIRALPPIPVNAIATTSVPSSKLDNQQQQQQQGRRRDGIDPSTPSSPPLSSSPPRLPPIITTTTATEKRPLINTKVARSSPGTIQSFSEAAALAINTGGILLGEGTSSPNTPVDGGGDGVKAGKEGQREMKRSSTASRVRFEEPELATVVSGDEDGPAVVPMEGERRRREEKTRFRLTPPTPTGSGGGGGGGVPEYPTFMAVGEYPSRSSFLDLSSQPPSLRSMPSVQRIHEHGIDHGGSERVWSMQLPGRRLPLQDDTVLKSKWSNTTMQTIVRTLGPSSSSSSSPSLSSNRSSGYGLRRQGEGVPWFTVGEGEGEGEGENEGEGEVLSPTTRENLFPFPLAIPPSPNMPEGFTGVEPSPSLMSPTVSLPVPFSSRGKKRRRRRRRRFLEVMGSGREHDDDEEEEDEEDGERSRNQSVRRTGNEDEDEDEEDNEVENDNTDATNSPTDSFPYSISDVHFRNSGVFVSEPEMEEDGGHSGRNSSRRSRHHHPQHPQHQPQPRQHPHSRRSRHHHLPPPPHPPLPSTSLSPQRFDPSSSSSLPQQQQQQQQPQQHDERTPGIASSIVQRVFGTSGNGNNGHNNGNGNGMASKTLRAAAAGFLKPS